MPAHRAGKPGCRRFAGVLVGLAVSAQDPQLADLRYGILLSLAEHYLLTSGDDRKLLTAWIFAEMRSRVAYIARQLTTMPTGVGDSVASIPLTLPAPLHPPGAETARWEAAHRGIHREVQEMQAASSSDQADPTSAGC